MVYGLLSQSGFEQFYLKKFQIRRKDSIISFFGMLTLIKSEKCWPFLFILEMFFFSISHFKGRALFCDEPAPGSSLTNTFFEWGGPNLLETLRLRLYDNRNAGIVPSSVINAHRKNCLKNIILAIFEAIFYCWGHQAIFCFFWAKFGCDFCKIWMSYSESVCPKTPKHWFS